MQTPTTMNAPAQTGSRDTTYDLVSVLYHALQGAETCMMYVEDAEQAGDEELADFFRDAIDSHRDVADEAKRHLGKRLSDTWESSKLLLDTEKLRFDTE